jgi:hypothetical protein
MATVGSLHKTTIVVWSRNSLKGLSLASIGSEVDVGDAYCSLELHETVLRPEGNKDWDGNDFFGEKKPEEGEPGGPCGDCWGDGKERVFDHKEGWTTLTDDCEHCKGTGIEPPEEEEIIVGYSPIKDDQRHD